MTRTNDERAAIDIAAARLLRRHVGGAADREPGRGQSRVAER